MNTTPTPVTGGGDDARLQKVVNSYGIRHFVILDQAILGQADYCPSCGLAKKLVLASECAFKHYMW